jgi:hypothetical protein
MKRATGMNKVQATAIQIFMQMVDRKMPEYLSVGEAASVCSDHGVHAPRWEAQARRGSPDQIALATVALFIARRIDD